MHLTDNIMKSYISVSQCIDGIQHAQMDPYDMLGRRTVTS